MKLGFLLTLITCAGAVIASKASELATKVNKKTGLVTLNDQTLSTYISGPRDYDMVLLLTATSSKYNCVFCQLLHPQFTRIASSWIDQHPESDGLFFAVADIDETRKTFQELGIQTAPNLWIYRKSDKSSGLHSQHDTFTFPPQEDLVTPIVRYLAVNLGAFVHVAEPIDHTKFATFSSSVVILLTLLIRFRTQVVKVATTRRLWTGISVVAILMFIAGHMFNMIRKAPFIANDGHGGIAYFVGGHSNQVVAETQIIAGCYGILAFSVVALVMRLPKIRDTQKQFLWVIAIVVLHFLAFSFVISKFQIKNGGYPYSFLKL